MELLHCGFVAIVGRPSSGKSTFLNTLCGFKVSIVSTVPQTTRNRIRAIYNTENTQIIFIDTPGIHFSEKTFNRHLTSAAKLALKESDAIVFLSDISRGYGSEEKFILDILKGYEDKTIVGLNKVDLKTREEANIRRDEIEKIFHPHSFFNLTAIDQESTIKLAKNVAKLLPQGESQYPADYYTDQGQEFRIEEIIREKVFNLTMDEIPHSTYIETQSIKVNEKADSIRIDAVIYVEKESQKGIVVGKKGGLIKKIGIRSRKDLEEIFGRRVDLFLKVKLHHKWRKDDKFLKTQFDF